MNKDDGSARTKTLTVNLCIALNSIAAGLLFLTHQIWPLLFAIPALYFLRKNRASTKEEENRREELSGKSFVSAHKGWDLS